MEPPGQDQAESLAALQLRIARRADEIAALSKARTPLNLLCWLQAEKEVLGSIQAMARSHARSAELVSAGD